MAEILVMLIKDVINIQEGKTVEDTAVVEWDLDMTAVPTTAMAVDATNLQEVNLVIAVLIGALAAEIGEPVATKVVPATVDMHKINI